ncbi:MAG TPA: hypothetical protein VFA64_03685 [Hyphomicrobiaceae bacterium]|nr:hypothetical protein [Hyphomicrobiaceae bacterium]
MKAEHGARGLATRLLWFVALWLAGVAAVALVGLVIRVVLA